MGTGEKGGVTGGEEDSFHKKTPESLRMLPV